MFIANSVEFIYLKKISSIFPYKIWSNLTNRKLSKLSIYKNFRQNHLFTHCFEISFKLSIYTKFRRHNLFIYKFCQNILLIANFTCIFYLYLYTYINRYLWQISSKLYNYLPKALLKLYTYFCKIIYILKITSKMLVFRKFGYSLKLFSNSVGYSIY